MNEILCFTAWFLAGLVNGISGMGAAMVALPFLSTFMLPQEFVPVSCIIVTIISANMAWNFRKGCYLHVLKPLFIGAIPGSVVGLLLLLYIPAKSLQLIIGITLLFFVIWQATKKISLVKNKETFAKSTSAGFCAGLMTTSISFGNPPIGIYALHLGWGHRESVGTMNIFSTGAYFIASCMQAYGGLYSNEILYFALIGIPASILGIFCSLPIAKRINAEVFRRVLLTVIFISGCICIYRTF